MKSRKLFRQIVGLAIMIIWITGCTGRDNMRIAFVSCREGNDTEIFVMDLDGSHLTPLTDNTANDTYPAWSPDGTRIAFESNRDGNWEIYVMDANGSNVIRLTTDPAYDEKPDWSPDGTHILFQSDRDESNPNSCGLECNSEIYVMNADGSNVTRLTNDPAWDEAPDWSPDGRSIAFISTRDDPNRGSCGVAGAPPICNFEIYTMDSNGANITRLTNDAAYDHSPAWSPDGASIAFASDRDGNWNIYRMDTDGSNITRLTSDTVDDYSPAWRPDGTQIAFSSGYEIAVLQLDVRAILYLTIDPAFDVLPAYRPVP